MEIILVLEAIEALHRYERQAIGFEPARASLRSRMPVFDILRQMSGLTQRQTAEITHHEAKAWRLLGDDARALALFEDLLEGFPLNEAKLQLTRLYARDPTRTAIAEMLTREIIDDLKVGQGVSNSVALGLADALHWAYAPWSAAILSDEEELFLSRALHSAYANVPQGYEVLATFARQKAWRDPASLASLIARLPDLSPFMIEHDRSRGAYAEIMHHAASRISRADYLPRALEAYEALRSRDSFQTRRWGETLLLGEQYAEAEAILSDIPDDSGRIWVAHSLSCAKLGLGKKEEARALVDEALSGAVGRHAQYRASFLMQRIKVRIAMGETPDDDIDEAEQCAENPAQIEELRRIRMSLHQP